jgi:hypothetical protein
VSAAASGVVPPGRKPFCLDSAGMATVISGVLLVAAFVAVAVLSGWLVVGMFLVSRGQPGGHDSDEAG